MVSLQILVEALLYGIYFGQFYFEWAYNKGWTGRIELAAIQLKCNKWHYKIMHLPNNAFSC